jgi:phytoene synthase
MTDDDLAEAYALCDTALRESDRDRWLACLFAPEALRRHLHALYAFSFEVARVRDVVSDPRMGEIRFQWWRDVLEGEGAGEAVGHPAAMAVLDTIDRFSLPRSAFIALIDARTFDLYDDPMPTLGDVEGYCGETASALMRLAALILAEGRDPGGADAAGHAGVAYALTGLMRALPWHSARGQLFLPGDVLGRHGVAREDIFAARFTPGLHAALRELRDVARDHAVRAFSAAKEMETRARFALLPTALVFAYCAVMDRSSYDPFRRLVELPQWRRQWILWRAARGL